MSEPGDAQGSPEGELRIWVNGRRGARLQHRGAILKDGRDVKKTVELTHYGSRDSGEIRKRELRFTSFDVRVSGDATQEAGANTKNSWHCENDEIDRLLAFLCNDTSRTGRYQLVDADSPGAALLDLLAKGKVSPNAIAEALARHAYIGEIVKLLADSDAGISAAGAAVLERRRKMVASLRRLTDDANCTELAIQKLIGDAYWIFGGNYVGVAQRRALTMLDQTDIPLLRADGTLHIVELKRPSISRLVVHHRNHWIAGPDVHEATAQAMNYLRALDEQGITVSGVLRNELGQEYDMSRVFATVVIGHSGHDSPSEAPANVVARTLRQYNAGINRVEVITYDQLVENAERSLAFERDAQQARSASASTASAQST
ncbi:Shedu anti-phage system protein SduA domain-containing protein [Amycolatopsis sp. MtRt-6]|uniref:Shedu anti-phage system protein SduA domain-containing protein n=1 Tax=Amycolatopsis sp. MtRt-6 TaxID=2792782 RepID=UPI001A902769|nr:Shedu anti-phage system protein SduA domain-containing protein [Amycolatopsis sp. MtRt-6]